MHSRRGRTVEQAAQRSPEDVPCPTVAIPRADAAQREKGSKRILRKPEHTTPMQPYHEGERASQKQSNCLLHISFQWEAGPGETGKMEEGQTKRIAHQSIPNIPVHPLMRATGLADDPKRRPRKKGRREDRANSVNHSIPSHSKPSSAWRHSFEETCISNNRKEENKEDG